MGAHDLRGASSRADWAVSGPFLAIGNFPAISYLATSSKKVATTQKKKVLKLSIQNVIFSYIELNEIGQKITNISKLLSTISGC
jgi:hypothetical protein